MTSAPHSPAAPIQRCDILIIGAGPAGMAAALAAAPSGASIVLVDDNPAPGGQIWRDGPGAHLPPLARTHRERLAGAANVRVLTGTRVVGSNSMLFGSSLSKTWRANSMHNTCMPRHRPR